MPTADSVRTVMHLLTLHEVQWALWRREDRSFLVQSDLDVVATAPLAAVLPDMRADLDKMGYRLLLQCRYDIAGANAIWLLDPEGKVLHLDVLVDPHGIGRLGISTTQALQTVTLHDGIPCVSPAWEMCYRVAKAINRSSEKVARLGGANQPSGLEAALNLVFGRRGGMVHQALTEQWGPERWDSLLPKLHRSVRFARIRRGGPVPLAVAIVSRAWQRMRHPVGAWIHFQEPVQPAIGYLAGLDIRSVADWPASRVRRWRRAVSLMVAVLRPRIVITWGPERRPPSWAGARVIDGADPNQVVEVLESRAWGRLR